MRPVVREQRKSFRFGSSHDPPTTSVQTHRGKSPMPSLEDRIAELVFAQFEKLPAKSKPTEGGDGARGWVPLSGIVLTQGT